MFLDHMLHECVGKIQDDSAETTALLSKLLREYPVLSKRAESYQSHRDHMQQKIVELSRKNQVLEVTMISLKSKLRILKNKHKDVENCLAAGLT